jgi:hypothetical protein
MDEIPKLKTGETRHRWLTAIKDKAFDSIRNMVVLETQAEHFMKVLESGSVSTNIYLRRVSNFALDMNWLPWPVLPKKRWPAFKFKEKRGITLKEHQAIVARELNPERRAFYKLAWHLGASQSDLAFIEAENVDWESHVISYKRMKTGTIAIMRMDEDMEEILRDLPGNGPLFPYLRSVRAGDRATEFKQRCVGLGIKGVSLHSYRYAWAERAKTAGYPERFAQESTCLPQNWQTASRLVITSKSSSGNTMSVMPMFCWPAMSKKCVAASAFMICASRCARGSTIVTGLAVVWRRMVMSSSRSSACPFKGRSETRPGNNRDKVRLSPSRSKPCHAMPRWLSQQARAAASMLLPMFPLACMGRIRRCFIVFIVFIC